MRQSSCRWLLMSFTSDWLFPPFQSREIVDALIATGRPVSYCNVESDCGHDAFLLPNQIGGYGELIRAFLANLGGEGREETGREDEGWALQCPVVCPNIAKSQISNLKSPLPSPSHTSIFEHRRLDYDTILDLIPSGASVLDLGCGNGELLARLRERDHHKIMGIEWDEQAIVACVRRGLDVVQTDLNKGLAAFADGQFDIVVLSQTLQAVLDLPRVLRDMLRVGRRGIVSFPNVAYRKLRAELAEKAAPRAFTPSTASNGTTPPMSVRSPSPTSRSSAASKASRFASKSPSTPKPTLRCMTIPISTPTWR